MRGFREEIGAPPVLTSVTGAGETGTHARRRGGHDHVHRVDAGAGRKIGVQAAERLIPCSLELGGNDPMIVLDDANLERAVGRRVSVGLFNAGQSCIAVERVYVEDAVHADRFVEQLTRRVSEMRVGMDGIAPTGR